MKENELPLKASWCEEFQWLEEAVHELPLQSMVSGKGPVMQVLPAGLHTFMCLVMVYVAVKLGTLAGAPAAAELPPGLGAPDGGGAVLWPVVEKAATTAMTAMTTAAAPAITAAKVAQVGEMLLVLGVLGHGPCAPRGRQLL